MLKTHCEFYSSYIYIILLKVLKHILQDLLGLKDALIIIKDKICEIKFCKIFNEKKQRNSC